jgi:hypothetical protein
VIGTHCRERLKTLQYLIIIQGSKRPIWLLHRRSDRCFWGPEPHLFPLISFYPATSFVISQASSSPSFIFLLLTYICLIVMLSKFAHFVSCNDSSHSTYRLEQRAYLSLHDCYNKQHLDDYLCCFLDPSHLEILYGIEGIMNKSVIHSP